MYIGSVNINLAEKLIKKNNYIKKLLKKGVHSNEIKTGLKPKVELTGAP